MNGAVAFPSIAPAPQDHDVRMQRAEIHIWKFTLHRPQDEAESLEDSLSEDEVQRANAFHFPRHRRRFVIRRGLQRRTLARYCGVEPGDIRFDYAALGKPALPQAVNPQNIQFSISHSADLALLACIRDQDIGVDIEENRDIDDRDGIVSRFFSDADVAAWRDKSGDDQVAAFYTAWTRKEAFIKALGRGLDLDLGRFSVSLEDTDDRLLSWRDHDLDIAGWRLPLFRPESNFSAALALTAADAQVCLFQG